MTGTKAFNALGLHMHQPSEKAFSMEMIPALVTAGYEDVVVDGVQVAQSPPKSLQMGAWNLGSICFLFWGDAWIPHPLERTDSAERVLAQAEWDPGLAGEGP